MKTISIPHDLPLEDLEEAVKHAFFRVEGDFGVLKGTSTNEVYDPHPECFGFRWKDINFKGIGMRKFEITLYPSSVDNNRSLGFLSLNFPLGSNGFSSAYEKELRNQIKPLEEYWLARRRLKVYEEKN